MNDEPARTPIKQIMATTLATVPSSASLRAVAEELAGDEIGLVLVEDGRQPRGVVSERDLITVMGTGGDLDGLQAVEVMSTDLVSAAPDEPVETVARRMLESGVRHILVRDRWEHAVGLVSVRDVLAALLA